MTHSSHHKQGFNSQHVSTHKASLKTGETPINFNKAIITPIYKGDFKNLPKNYSHVALASRLIKMLQQNISKKYPQIPGNESENEP